MKTKEIYDILRSGGLSHAGALGMIGNMMAEAGSSLPSNIAQRGMTKLSDAQYTAAADNGLIDFVHDAVGYGLCQWTYKTRKQALLDYAKSCGVSVGNGVMQCEFVLRELLEYYPELWKFLKETDDIDEASDRICKEFERPAVNNLLTRRDFAHGYEAETREDVVPYKPKDPVEATFPPDPTIKAFQLWMFANGYWEAEKINGHKSKEFFSALEQFVKDMQTC